MISITPPLSLSTRINSKTSALRRARMYYAFEGANVRELLQSFLFMPSMDVVGNVLASDLSANLLPFFTAVINLNTPSSFDALEAPHYSRNPRRYDHHPGL